MDLCSKILKIDLSTKEVTIETKDEEFMRMYLGGGALGVYYLLTEMPPGADALGTENRLVFSASVVAGAPISGLSRYTVTARSPLTGLIGDSQAGGDFAVELRSTGYVAVVIKGKSENPVYIIITDEGVEIRDASNLWGLEPAQCQKNIKEQLNDDKVVVAQIGVGGEKLVRFACIVSELTHFNGRTGMGAVMGSKNLKAVVVRGRNRPSFDNSEAINAIAKMGVQKSKVNDGVQFLRKLGTAGAVAIQNSTGGLPSKNFSNCQLEGAERISGEELFKSFPVKSESCYRCAIACKKKWQNQNEHEINLEYGAPEYESLASLGAYTGVIDPLAVIKANELCSKFTLDTISTGAIVAMAMECYEKGILTNKQTNGLSLKFGDSDALIEIINMIAKRQGIGDELAEGTQRAAALWGKGAEDCVIAVKGLDLPAHMPRIKKSLSLAYAINPFGADHMSSEHDGIYSVGSGESWDILASIGLYGRTPIEKLNSDKTRFYLFTQRFYSLLDTLNLCAFCFAPGWLYAPAELVEVVKAVTGWNVTLHELMLAGERRINMQRVFNSIHGASPADDTLPKRLFMPLESGPSEGYSVDEDEFNQAKDLYYSMAGWDKSTGWPTHSKLTELSLDWLISG
ncbi:aldehyde ferredoxin oxidoreductase family protein [Metallumcola ferriviriculae]|uniref:Aldehyde ferredoxin oxidoreductase family protein n=1 Tax=Metallumcola ferriviriculae TaxID=3039180 RepID=A0AAU0UM56_9FIRM|nr:aldehyde ferredoxin oxidoreductase family protein [Desulfitibacteraceae bacterium MK1]